jgi:Uma2 family endonuclease
LAEIVTSGNLSDMAAVAEKQAKHWTYEEYYKLDDDQRYEVIDGHLILMSPAPRTWHQHWVGELYALLLSYNKKHKLGSVYVSPVDVVLSEENCVQPDIVFVLNENKGIIQDRAIFGAPDIAIELMSPSTSRRDRREKKALYERFGVKEYWLGDPTHRIIEVYVLRDGRYALHGRAEEKGVISSLVLRGFEFDLAEID